MLQYLIPLVAEYLNFSFIFKYIYPIFCICFIGSIPGLLRMLTRWR